MHFPSTTCRFLLKFYGNVLIIADTSVLGQVLFDRTTDKSVCWRIYAPLPDFKYPSHCKVSSCPRITNWLSTFVNYVSRQWLCTSDIWDGDHIPNFTYLFMFPILFRITWIIDTDWISLSCLTCLVAVTPVKYEYDLKEWAFCKKTNMSLTDKLTYAALVTSTQALQWRQIELDGVSNHQPRDCLLNHLYRRRSQKASKLRVNGLCAGIHWSKIRVTGFCAGNSPVTDEFLAQRANNAENASIWWLMSSTWGWVSKKKPRPHISLNVGRFYWQRSSTVYGWFDTFIPVCNDRHFTDDIFKSIFLCQNSCTLIRMSIKVVPMGTIENN